MTWLKIRGDSQDNSGLRFSDRILLRGAVRAHPIQWFLLAWMQSLLLTAGVLLTVVTSWEIQTNRLLLAVGTLLLTALWTAFFLWEKLRGKRRYLLFAAGLLYAVLLLATQRRVEQGAFAVWNAVLRSINVKYHMELSLISVSDPGNVTWFLQVVLIPLGLVLCALTVYRADGLLLSLLLIPVVSFLLLFGGTPWEGALLMLLLGVLAAWASGRTVWKKRLWGEPSREEYRRNVAAFHTIQRKTALLVCTGCLIMTIPILFWIQPVLVVRLHPAEQLTQMAEGKFISLMTEWMPLLSNGQISLQVEATGTGVSDGVLGETDGFVIKGVEDLYLTCSDKPRETLYLKGFIGTKYESDRWAAEDESAFLSAASGWKTEGSPALYVQNLPFLRTMYTEEQEPHLLIIQRLNASDRYTYHPYNGFLSDYYQVIGGDGAVEGLGVDENRFSFFFREETTRLLEKWELEKEASSVLDRVAESYAGYVSSKALVIPGGFEDLQEQCLAEGLDKENLEEIRRYIRLFLAENYVYDLNVPVPDENEDFLKQFLYETKRGYSAHFATAAVVMFRMFGVPARYVTGYAVPQNLFTQQINGTWTAVAQDDNAHAWAEVFVKGVGWMPMEMTPGMIGTEQDLSFDAEIADEPEDTKDQEAEQPDEVPASEGDNADTHTGRKILVGTAASLLGILCAGMAVVLYRKHRRAYGLDTRRSPSLRGQDLFQTYFRTMVRKGMSEKIESTSAEFIRCATTLDEELTNEMAAELVRFALKCCYSPQEPQEQEMEMVRTLLIRMKKSNKKIS